MWRIREWRETLTPSAPDTVAWQHLYGFFFFLRFPWNISFTFPKKAESLNLRLIQLQPAQGSTDVFHKRFRLGVDVSNPLLTVTNTRIHHRFLPSVVNIRTYNLTLSSVFVKSCHSNQNQTINTSARLDGDGWLSAEESCGYLILIWCQLSERRSQSAGSAAVKEELERGRVYVSAFIAQKSVPLRVWKCHHGTNRELGHRNRKWESEAAEGKATFSDTEP